MEPSEDDVTNLYADLRATITTTVHEIMNTEIVSLRSLVRYILDEEIEAHKADIAREVMKEIAGQVRFTQARRC